jgi:trehalose-phosphatase
MARPETPERLAAAFLRRVGGREAGLLLDYDGTIADIRGKPDQASIADEERAVLTRLARSGRARVAVITGRSLAGLLTVSGPLDGVVLGVNGGLQIVSPEGTWTHPKAERLQPRIRAAASELKPILDRWPGTLLEDKVFSLTAHYRLHPEAGSGIHAAVAGIVARSRGELRSLPGKYGVEIQPAVEWDKGRAADRLLDEWGVGDASLFMGDDRIDEPAFEAVNARHGMTIRIGASDEPSAAGLLLESPADAREFLRLLAATLAP